MNSQQLGQSVELVFPPPGISVTEECESLSHTSKEGVLSMKQFHILGSTPLFFEEKKIKKIKS